MKTRVISGTIGFILLLAVVFSGQLVISLAFTVVALIGIGEFYKAVGNLNYKPIKVLGYISCLSLLFLGLNGQFELVKSSELISLYAFAAFLLCLVSFAIIIFTGNKYNVTDISLTIFGIVYIVFLFSFLILTRKLDNGKYYIWFIFIGAFATDTFAYFTGRLIGRTKKFIPAIVPTKTLEGCIGGAVGCGIALLVYGLTINKYIGNISIIHFIIMGLICGVISQIGDWSASAIKRYVKIKDYGTIMPGHGGVLDRFDSILFIAPVIYFYLIFFLVRG